jgi:DNA-binding CsgD family transcriptional regulator
MSEKTYAETFVFMLYGDGTFAWANAIPSGESFDEILGESAWKRCDPADENRVRDGLVKLVLENKQELQTTIRNLEGDRFLVCMRRLPLFQPAQHTVVGWCRRLSDEVLTLTHREREILLLVCEEMTSEQIGKRLHIATNTVETHRQNIAKKLGTSSVVGQVRAAIRGGLIEA